MCELDLDRRQFLAAMPAASLALAPAAAAAASGEKGPKKTLLCIGAHRDDSEGAAGLMFKALDAGHRVVVVQAVSDYSNWPPTIGREQEVSAATQKIARDMGIEKILLGYKYHQVPVDNEIKIRIAKIVDDVQPDIVLVMSETDYWTDHANMARVGRDAVMFAHGYLGRTTKRPDWILSYAAGFNQTYEFKPDVFVDVSDVIDRVSKLWVDLDAVISGKPNIAATLTLHNSGGKAKQLELSGHGERVLAANMRWGDMCGVRYAEAYRAIVRKTTTLW